MTPDLIIVNADICTMDPLFPRVTALAVVDGRIAALGSDGEIRNLASSSTRVINAGGRFVLPGLQDAHIHLQEGGHDLAQNAALWSVRSVSELKDVMRAHEAKYDGPFVMGAGWQPGVFTERNLTRHVLDEAVTERPCLVYDSGYHNACINSYACQLLGLKNGMPDPANGHFVRDENGEPTGMLHEDAIYWARERLPQRTDDDYYLGVLAGQAHCNEHGITGVLDAQITERHARVYERLDKAGKLTVRVAGTGMVYARDSTGTTLERLEGYRRQHRSEMFKVHSAKFFLDGVLENRTAAMLEPYRDGEGGNAPLMFGHNQIKELFTAVDAARFQIHVHVIGDGAVRAALDGLEAARLANGDWPSLHQLAHVQVIDPADVPRFRQLGVMANLQALWARSEPDVPDFTMEMVGPRRAPWVYAFRSLIDAGAPFCLSSDWPVSSLNPFEIMETALTRQLPLRQNPAEPFYAEQRLTPEECVRAYTINAAAACWRSGDTGSLSIGKYADVIVLDRNILTCGIHEVSETKVLLTLLGGREVHRSASFDG